jgi:hypothetical protein
VKRTIDELFNKVDQRLAALEEKIAATEGRREFQFARERDDEASELPNPLPPRRAIN